VYDNKNKKLEKPLLKLTLYICYTKSYKKASKIYSPAFCVVSAHLRHIGHRGCDVFLDHHYLILAIGQMDHSQDGIDCAAGGI